MKHNHKLRSKISLIGLFIILLFFINVNYIKSDEIVDPTLEFDSIDFQMVENSVDIGYKSDVGQFDFNLPDLSWKINELEFNFTNVEFLPETIIVEGEPTNSELIDKFHDGYGVQIAIHDPTIVYGAYIYGNNVSSENLPITVQIQGYDSIYKIPNGTVFGASTSLNMSYSETPSWHLQMFPDPIYLIEGNYYFIIDGTIIGNSPKSDYHWYLNDINPYHPELYRSSLNSGSWSEGVNESTFLYKLIQKVNISFYPEDVNMTAQLDQNLYKVNNGNGKGEGYLKKSEVNYHPNKKNLTVEVKNNRTNGLKFNLEYRISIENIFIVLGSVIINYNNDSVNQWSLSPNITRKSDNYTVRYIYPVGWNDLKVYRNSQDFTMNVSFNFNENTILIPNETIRDGDLWEIGAYSSLLPISITAGKDEFKLGQELRFAIGSPALSGTYNFILYDPFNIIIYDITRNIPLENNVFSYPIPSNADEGNYLALIFWNNGTDGGMTTQIFRVISATLPSEMLDFSLIMIIGIIAAAGSGIGFTGYSVIKRVDSNKREKLRIILEKCNDILNLEYIIVLDMKSGIDVYSQSFSKKELDSTLISGFLQAIHNFGVEVIEGAKESRTVKVEYQKSIVIMTDFINVRLITIMKNSPSENFLYNIESLAYDIYKDFGTLLEKFEGGLKQFQAIKKLVEKNYNVKFIYPLKAVMQKTLKLNQEERIMVKKAINFMKENNIDYFYSVYLLPENACGPKDYETILNLIEKGVFEPLEKQWV